MIRTLQKKLKEIKFFVKLGKIKCSLFYFFKSNMFAAIFVGLFLTCVVVLIAFFNSLIANHDKELSQQMCSLLTEKVTTSISYLVESTVDKSKLIEYSAIDSASSFEDIYDDFNQTKKSANYFSIGIILDNGEIYASPSEKEELKTQGLTTRALNNMDTFVSKPYRSKINGQMVFTILANINLNEKKLGCVFVTYDFNKIIDLAYSDSIDERAEISLVDSSSLNIIRCFGADKEFIGNWSNLKLDKSGSEYDAYMDCVGTINKGYDIAFNTYKVDGQTYTVVFKKIDQMEGWSVVISIINSAFSRAISDFKFAVIIFFGCTLIATIFLFTSFVLRANKEKARLEKISKDVIKAFATAVDFNDPYTAGHSRRVGEYSKEIAKRIGLNEEDCSDVYYSGLLHDVGKLGIDNSIINKPAKLDDKEYSEIKRHPDMGYEILKDISLKKSYADGAKYHHERVDGHGYPNQTEQIPLVARIIAVADAYDAMTSKRAYRGIMPQAVVREQLKKNAGTQFDKDIVGVMLNMIDEDKDYNMHQPE